VAPRSWQSGGPILLADDTYGAQRELLLAHGVGWASYVIPATVDVLAIMSNLALTLPRRDGFSRRGLWFILVLTLTVSSVANWMSGHGPVGSTSHVWVVVAYFLAEYIVNWVRSYRAAWATEMEVTEAALQEAVTEVTADEAASPDLPAAPTSPAPAGTSKREPYGPRNGVEYSPRQKTRRKSGR
jgi:hypothetical protein